MKNLKEMKRHALALFDAGVAAADPQKAIQKALATHPVASQGRLFVISVGKAAVPMARAALELLGPVDKAIIVTNPENAAEVPGAELCVAAHPVPDRGGLEAATKVFELAGLAQADDHVIVLVSGGGSSLLPLPVAGVTLAEKMRVNELLLGSGADIAVMNEVRQHVSRIKGGGLARRAAPADVTTFILSDVVGDHLSAIASGPTVDPIGTKETALKRIEELNLLEAVPPSVVSHLRVPEPAPAASHSANYLIGSNAVSVAAMADVAGPSAIVHPSPLEGDVEDAAELIVKTARRGAGLYLFGGETTVKLHGAGRGGRNQHLALKTAHLMAQAPIKAEWCFLSGGTDGRDGPTDAAGALVDKGTCGRCESAGVDVAKALSNNDSYTALQASGDLLITGGTGTNVADLQVLIVGP